MTLTPGLTLLGLLLVLLAIPLAFSFGPLVIGVIVLAYAARRAHVGLARRRDRRSAPSEGQPAGRGPAAAIAASTWSA